MGDVVPLLEARHVWKWLAGPDRPPALHDVSLTVRGGSWCTFTGPSGAGKTTLLSLLGALDRPSRGEILLDGENLTGLTDLALARTRRRIGYVFQNFALLERLPLWENVTYPLVPRGVRPAARRRRAEALLERLGLGAYAEKRPEELSGGERQRAAIARALIVEPEILIADEPTSSLDPGTAERVRELLREVHAAGVTLLIATHDPEVVAVADQVVRLDGGSIVAPDTAS